VNFKRHEVVTEHQVRGNGAEKFGVYALFAKINEGAAIALRKLAGEFALVLLLRQCRLALQLWVCSLWLPLLNSA